MSKTIEDCKQAIRDMITDQAQTSTGAYNVLQLSQAYGMLVDAAYREWSYSTARIEPKDAQPLQNALGES